MLILTHPIASGMRYRHGDLPSGVAARGLPADLGALGLGALDAAGAVLADAAGRVALLQPRLLDLPRQRLVPPHARRVLRAQVDQRRLQKKKVSS